MSAVALGALLTTYAGGLRNFSYVRAEPLSAFAGCSAGAIPAADDTALQAAVTNSFDGAVICITENITVSRTLVLDDTSVTLEADDSTVELSGGGVTRVLYADFTDPADDSLILRYLTITQGTSLNADDSDGGAVLVKGVNRDDTFIGEDITVKNSYSFEDGGGIALEQMHYARLSGARFYDDSAQSDSGAFEINYANSVVIENSTFKRNTAINEQGGAFEFQDVLDVRVYSSKFSNNEARSDGGSIQIFSGSDFVRLSDTQFLDDSSGDDGGSAALENITTLRIDDVTVSGGRAADVGGGLFLFDDTDVQITNSTFRNNTSLNSGGGIQVSSQRGPITLTDVKAYDNTSSTGSGGFLRLNPAVDVTVTRLTSRGNEAGADGGSIRQTAGTLTLSSSTLNDDSAGVDGGALSTSGLTAVSLTSVTVTGARAGRDGGALYSGDDTRVTIADSTFTSNIAGDDGGALEIVNTASLYLTNTVVRLNQASGDDGGGILVNNVDDTISLSSVTLDRNSTAAEGGGVKIVNSDGLVIMDDITATGNTAGTQGGAIYVNDPVSTTIRNSRFSGNYAGNDGGGAWLSQDALTLTTSSFADNAAGDYGGGASVYNVNAGLNIYDTTFSGNSAVSGAGGLYAEFAGQADITNSTFAGNSHSDPSGRGGGGLWLDGAAGQATLEFLTVVGNNTVSQGGGLYLGDLDAIVTNSIVAGNTAGGIGADVYLGYGFFGGGVLASLDDSYSLFTSSGSIARDDSAGAFSFTPGSGTIFGAPRLNGLADNGGPTLTMLPEWDSPAFQAGDPNWTAPPANDQRGAGFPRDAGGRVSMGAIQGRSAQPPAPVFPPSAPREVTAAAGDEQAVVSWTAPATSGSFPVTTYQVDDSTGEFACLVTVAPGQPLACVIEDLTNGVAYSFRVRALNGAGWGAWSAFTDPVTPRPGASILISGSRDGRFARVSGEAPGLEGDVLVPRLRFPGPNPYADGKARPVVDDAGEFAWQRRTNKKVYVYFFTEDRELRSNRVIIAPRR